jgi:signal transduction histidine kinase
MTETVRESDNQQLSFEEIQLPLLDGAGSRTDSDSTSLAVPPTVRAMLSPLIAALRWCAVVLGVALAAPDAANGDVGLVITTSICLYLTTWRTMRPLTLGSNDRTQWVMGITDTTLLGAAVGVNEGLQSPFAFCVAAAAAVAAFGWGVRHGLASLGGGIAGMAISAVISGGDVGLGSQAGWIVLGSIVTVVVLLGLARNRLMETEVRRAQLAGRLDALAETNELLHVLNRVARTLPSSLDLQQAVEATRGQLTETFDASVVGLLTLSEVNNTWAPLIAEGLAIPPTVARDGIPDHLRACLDSDTPLLVSDVSRRGLGAASGSGIYTALRTRGKVVGLLAIEHPVPNHYTAREARLLAGLAEALALTIDNARWFRRLRILGAEEERARIARDLHDRLGQWLTYISFELERIKTTQTGDVSEIDALHQDVQRAIDDLRETLRQMRTSVTDDQRLTAVAADITDRFTRRTGINVNFSADESGERFPIAVENELLRIMQEALNNIDKHANASAVRVDWEVGVRQAHLRIADDGDGFDESHGVRETAFGLVGMRERAEVIDAELVVNSSPGAGTTIDVIVPREERS